MDALTDIIAYFHKYYTKREQLRVSQVTHLIYLADWKSVLLHKKLITNTAWRYGDTGPIAGDVIDAIMKYKDENIYWEHDPETVPKEYKQYYVYFVSQEAERALAHVVSKTVDLDRDDFTKLVYSTFPMLSTARYAMMDFENAVIEYEKIKKHMESFAAN